MRNKIKVAVLRGGPSSEYEVSLKTGAEVLKNLDPKVFTGIDVLIDREGVFHIEGKPIKPEKLHVRADVAFIALHGEYGEDGTIQKFLETHNIPFTGSKTLASALGMNKELTKKIFVSHGIKTPAYKVIDRDSEIPLHETTKELFEHFMQPSVIKPFDKGSSIGVFICHTFNEIQEALENVFKISRKAIVEECIKGKEATCGVLEDFRGQKYYALPPVEIVPKKHQKFFDFESKYSGTEGAKEICPGDFKRKETESIESMAIEAHKALGARHYSRVDFMVHPKRGVFALEVNTLPGLTETSLLPKEMEAVGSSYKELLTHLITLALERK